MSVSGSVGWRHTNREHRHAAAHPLPRPLALGPLLHPDPEALADALADALPQALAQLASDRSTAAIVQSGDTGGLHPGQVLTLQIATLQSFLDVSDAANS